MQLGLRTRRRLALAITAIAAACLGVAFNPGAAQQARYFRIGTGPFESTLFQAGALISNVVSSPPGARDCERGGSCGVTGLIAIGVSTAGSQANVAAIGQGQLESGLSHADVAYWAFHGTGVYRRLGAVRNLRAIANLYPETIQIVVRADSTITEIRQLRAKRVAVGEQDSGTQVTARLVLQAYGLGERDIRPQYLEAAAAAEALRDKRIEALFQVAGTPDPVLAELAGTVPLRLLAIDGDQAARLRASYPFIVESAVGPGTYPGVAATTTIGVGTLWVVSAEAEEQTVYGLTRALFHPNNRKTLDNARPLGPQIRLDRALDGVALQLHPGAALYYFESGMFR